MAFPQMEAAFLLQAIPHYLPRVSTYCVLYRSRTDSDDRGAGFVFEED